MGKRHEARTSTGRLLQKAWNEAIEPEPEWFTARGEMIWVEMIGLAH